MDENKQTQADGLDLKPLADTAKTEYTADKVTVPSAQETPAPPELQEDNTSGFTWEYLFDDPIGETQEETPTIAQDPSDEEPAITLAAEVQTEPTDDTLAQVDEETPTIAQEQPLPPTQAPSEEEPAITLAADVPPEPADDTLAQVQEETPTIAQEQPLPPTQEPSEEEPAITLAADVPPEPADDTLAQVQEETPAETQEPSTIPLLVDNISSLMAESLPKQAPTETPRERPLSPTIVDSPTEILTDEPLPILPKIHAAPVSPCDRENKPSPQPKLKKASAFKKIFSVSLRSVATLFKTALLLLFIPLIVYVNFTVDCSGMFHSDDFEEAAVQKLVQGENLDNYDNLDERKINSLYILGQEEPLDLAALGSSRILQLSAEAAATTSFFNFGVSGGDFEDMVGTFYQMELANMLPKNLVLGIDPWLLNPDKDASSPRSDKELYKEFLTLRLGIPTDYIPYNPLEPFDIESVDKAPLFDLAYFQSNVQFWMQNPTYSRVNPATVQNLEINNNNVKTADGSVMYSQEFRNVSPEDAQSKAQAMTASFPRMENFTELNAERCELFSLFVDYVQAKGVNVVFVLAPFHPLVYSYITAYKSLFTGFLQTEPWFANFAHERNIPLYGSFNPYVAECYREDFYDGWHMHREALTGMFPGVGTMLQDQANGEAGSSWFVDGERISAKRAAAAIMDQYPAPDEYSLTAAGTTTILNIECYVYERHKTDESPAPLIDRFAVSKDEGLVYRYEASAGGWIVDARF